MANTSNDEDCDYLFKTVLVGDSAVGKSNLLSRFAKDEFFLDSKPTIGAMLVYDITRRPTFENLTKWLHELREFGNQDMVIVLVGNKSDLKDLREVDVDDAQRLAQLENLCFMETSAKDNLNVEDAFLQMINKIYEIASLKNLNAKKIESNPNLDGKKEIIVVDDDELASFRHNGCCGS
ncbi:hypothetical protein E3N88_03085 [Mikania micrantha]|uniref:Uncharacterized protein n=1 Tax=Mikania micrantha TaxID=192012 RepID=A0A5N6Q5R2_9ASTR|nr:hypothetical protein E3N88_03085 [Mikania micrantha]